MSRRFQVFIHPHAEQDMDDVHEWIARDNPQAADRWYDGLLDALLTLESHPERFRLSPETRRRLTVRETRQMLYGKGFWKYRVLYEIRDNTVAVLHVRHGARRWLGEMED